MAKSDLGTKRICPTTGKKFYDLNKTPVISPYTGEVVPIAPIVPPARLWKPLAASRGRKVMKTNSPVWLRNAVCGVGLAIVLASTGCQGVYNGQTLPSPWYISDDIQYFPPGPEFKLSREAAAMKAYKADLQAAQAGQ